MGKLIVTNTKIAHTPYRMKETNHLLYSYEELVFYIMSRMPLWLLEQDRKGLTEWIRERGISLIDTDDLSVSEASEEIIRAGTYLRKEEQEQVLERIQNYERIPDSLREKEKGDLYLQYGKLMKAYFSYEKAIRMMEGNEETGWKASLYHNRGLISIRLFYWEEARNYLTKALSYEEREETKTALTFVEEMEKTEWKTGKEPVLSIELERKKKAFLEEL